KIKRTPAAAKLLGASHAYLWGEEIIAAEDIKDWNAFGKAFKATGESDQALYPRELWQAMKPETRKLMAGLETTKWVDRYTKSQVLAELNHLLAGGNGGTNDVAVCRANSQKLFEAFPGLMLSPEDWGNGVSRKMIARLADAGIDRLWLGADGWEAFE